MQIKLKFLGAAQNVTGSRHFLQANGASILVDCGLYQERQFRDRNWDSFPIPPNQIDAVLLTHAHLDHCGLMPKLVKEGFKGKIFCTEATAEIAQIIMLDSARLQVEDAEYKKKRHKKQGKTSPHGYEPLYTVEDAEATFPHFSRVKYNQTVKVAENINATFCDAGHVLGSSTIRVDVTEDGISRSVLFSGDIGRPNRPIVHDPKVPDRADYVVVESTYGDRVHRPTADIKETVAEIINSTVEAGGNIIIPSFALERSQEILFYLSELLQEGRIPQLPVFLDSPMAIRITKVFKEHPELYDHEMRDAIQSHQRPFSFPGLHISSTTDESKAIKNISTPIMVIAGSGMCTGGRVKHHLVNNISEAQNTIMFIGYQAVGTPGRSIVDGIKEVRILGEKRQINARIAQVHGFSSHADKEEILTWLRGIKQQPKGIFVVHGEAESAKAFGRFLEENGTWQVNVPEYQQEFTVD